MKIIFLMFVYFAGFATSMYILGPEPVDQISSDCGYKENLELSESNSNKFAESFNSGMYTCMGFAKDVSIRMTQLVKQKLEERKQQNE